jgi:N-acetylglutamate synthase-like GNAT family acetyltransferase
MLRRCIFDEVSCHAAEAHADGLILSRAMAHQWYVDKHSTGFVGTKQDAHTLLVGALFVHPGMRKVGNGTRILREVIEAAGKRDIEVVCAPALHRWFGKQGFIAVSKLRDKKDVWLLRRPVSLGD